MPSANVLLKEGLSYSYPDGANLITFRQGIPVTVSGRELIDKLKTISCLAVEEHQDKPAKPLRAVGKPAPAPEPELEPEVEDVEEPADEAEEQPEATDEEPLEETTEEPEPEPEPVKPAPKGGNKGGKAKGK